MSNFFESKPRPTATAKPRTQDMNTTTASHSTAFSNTSSMMVSSRSGKSSTSQVRLLTNQYKLSLNSELNFYQYDIQIMPDNMADAYIIQSIFRTIRKKLEMIVPLFVISGRSLYTCEDLQDTLLFETDFRGMHYTVIINTDSKTHFNGSTLQSSKMSDNNVVFNLINIVIKQALRDTQLRQIGKQPRFFDISKAISIDGSGLQACPGFRASAFNYTSGLVLVLDNINKFLSNKSCLERIQEILDSELINDKKGKVLEEFKYKSVIGNWGMKKAYIVMDVIFDKTPVTQTFLDHQGNKFTIADYFNSTYKLKITNKRQPLFMVKINGKECHIPPEFCSIDGVPQQIREDPRKMKNVLQACRKNPD